MYDFFKHKFFGAARATVPAPVLTEDDRALKRGRLHNAMREDLSEHRKLAWLRAQRPRLTKGRSGFWWCVSHHKTPMGSPYQRIGSGETPRAAYDAWMGY